MKIVICFVFCLLSACSSINQSLNSDTVYKKDVRFWVGKKRIVGMGVVPRADVHEIFIQYDEGKIDLLSVTSCHRNDQITNEGSKAYYVYKPAPIERDSGCPLDIGIYDKKGRHGWGYLLFERTENLLPVFLQCNGETTTAIGVSVCQAQIGSVQRLSFDRDVKVAASEGCDVHQIARTFDYEVSKEFCYYSFIDDAGNVLDHTSFGYETFIYRE
jgi:hypothetical protein